MARVKKKGERESDRLLGFLPLCLMRIAFSLLLFFSFYSLSFLFFVEVGWSEVVAEKKEKEEGGRAFFFSGYFQNFFIFRTDSDFDPSPAIYQPWGQTVGVLGTYAEPRFTFITSRNTYFSSEFLVGFNLWSRNSPFDRPDVQDGRQLFVFLRQFFSSVNLGERSKIKVGYQYFADPLEVFVRHWIAGAKWEIGSFQFFVGQIPDQTYEGVEVFSNNFVNDTFIFSIAFSSGGFLEKDGIPQTNPGFFAGIYNLFDNSVIRKPRFFSTGIFGYFYDTSDFSFLGGVAGQFGVMRKNAFGGQDELSTAGALQISFSSKGKTTFGGNLMVLSPDNPKYREGRNLAFLYSGKSMSRTLVLTEDEIIFKSDNLDLNMGEDIVSFKLMRAGYLVADLWLDIPIFGGLNLIPVAGAGFTLSGENSGKNNFIGAEGDIIIRYERKDLVFDLANIIFVPGRASAYFINKINPEKLRTFIYSLEISLKVLF